MISGSAAGLVFFTSRVRGNMATLTWIRRAQYDRRFAFSPIHDREAAGYIGGNCTNIFIWPRRAGLTRHGGRSLRLVVD